MAYAPNEDNIKDNIDDMLEKINNNRKKATFDSKTKKIVWINDPEPLLPSTRPTRKSAEERFTVKPGKPILPDDIDDEPLYHEIEE